MFRSATFAAGSVIAAIGTIKALSHNGNDLAAALAASWCGTPAADPAGFWESVQAHCWGCGVAPLGAAIMLWAARPALLVAWRAVAGGNGRIQLEQG